MKPKRLTKPVKRMLVVDDDADFRWVISNVLRDAGYKVDTAEDGRHALHFLQIAIPHLILLDYRMPGMDGLSLAAEIKKKHPAMPILIITAYAEVDVAIKAIRMGIYDYVIKPVNNQDLISKIERALEKQQLTEEINHLKEIVEGRANLYELMGNSDAIKKIVSLIDKVAPTNLNVLIEGESGTGKELLARAIHASSTVKNGPFIDIDCGAIPETLIESELFGYMRGAFTGAYRDKPGHFELADGGTLFLDEVGNIPYPSQHKLLRAIEERRIMRLGARKTLPVGVRIVAASNTPLEEKIAANRFRNDLYYRLNEFSLRIPPLRDRKEDIAFLVNKFIGEMERETGGKCAGMTKEALGLLYDYDWPGNVRELKNVIRKASVVCGQNDPIALEDMLTVGMPIYNSMGNRGTPHHPTIPEGKTLREVVELSSKTVEKSIIEATLKETKGNKSAAARKLCVDYKTLLRKIKSHHIAK